MNSDWLGKLFILPPDDQRKNPFPKKIKSEVIRNLSSAFYIQLLILRSVPLVTFAVGLLYFITGIFHISINFGVFVFAMPPHNFIQFFVNDFGKRIPFILIVVSLYYGCFYLRNVPDLDYIFEQYRGKGRTDGDAVFSRVVALLIAFACSFGSFGLPMLFLEGTASDSVFNNSYLLLFVILAFDSLLFCLCVMFLTESVLGLCYYFPKYYRKKKLHTE